ncbi:MAG: 16S rRNA (cytidine(1402)-2'-O)-methyltransferase [Magnetococcales bacterium]|nr:16S rRNA (cytidine(1402)-2'-O)-methyltransferase [Magnetococcales bacterium]
MEKWNNGKVTTGKLYIVPTPIGNLEDMTFRAVRVLKEVERILAEDTRHSRIVCSHYGIETPMSSFNDHNAAQRLPMLLERLRQGAEMALVTDAGTPGISDPGLPLLQAVIAAGIRLEVLPGPSAVVTALSGSGFSLARFVFEGFLPRKGKARQQRLAAIAKEERTVVLYEAPLRMAATLSDLLAHGCAGRGAVVARELTKHFESWHRGSVSELATLFQAQAHKGEMVLLLQEQSLPSPSPEQAAEMLQQVMDAEVGLGQAARQTARLTGVSRNQLYRLALARRQAEQQRQERASGERESLDQPSGHDDV